MNRVRCLIFNAALGPLDYRVPAGMVVEPGRVMLAPLGPRQIVAAGGSRRLNFADFPITDHF